LSRGFDVAVPSVPLPPMARRMTRRLANVASQNAEAW
jgi:hypothetical protein